MIQLSDFHLQFGPDPLLVGVDLQIPQGTKAGIVGRNGTGKSSLFKALLGEIGTDSKELQIARHLTIAHMAQEVSASAMPSIDYVLAGDQHWQQLTDTIESAQQDASRGVELAKLLDQYEQIDGYTARSRGEQILMGLGFSETDLTSPVQSFSGGWRMRLNLARALMCPSDVLLLDEPTNHLDLDTLYWLEDWLNRYQGTLLLISHDRDFIDNIVGHIYSFQDQSIVAYSGNYSSYERQKAERLSQQAAAFKKQQAEIAHIESFVRRFKAKASKAKQAQSRVKMLDRMERIGPAHIDSPFKFTIAANEKLSMPMVSLDRCTLGYGDTAVLSNVDISLNPGDRIGLLGGNGAGKSTLVKALVDGSTITGGERVTGEHCYVGYFAQHQLEALDSQASPLLHLKRLDPKATDQSLRDFLGGFDFKGERTDEAVGPFSGGEKARLALALIVYKKPNILLLDEPTNHLDLEMRTALTMALQTFEGAIILVSHDRYLLASSVDTYLLVDKGSVSQYKGDLESYHASLLQPAPVLSDARADQPPAPSAVPDKKAQRQAAAEQRKLTAPITKAIKQNETRSERLQEKLEAIEEKLGDTRFYEPENAGELTDLLREQGDLRKAIDELEGLWFELQEQLEALNS